MSAAACALTVEVHDVTPAAEAENRAICTALSEVGVFTPTLLVVPRYEDARGRSWDLRQHPQMAAWLRARQEDGSEIVLHGLTHRAPGRPPPGLVNLLMHHCFSRGCAEFAHLDADRARARLQAGIETLEQCGLRPAGFIAPAWEQSPAALALLSEMGFAFTAFFNKVVPLRGGGPVLHTPALTFDAPGLLVDLGKRAVMLGLQAAYREAPLLRLALHPADLHGAGTLAHVLQRLGVLLGQRSLVSYSQFLVRTKAAGRRSA